MMHPWLQRQGRADLTGRRRRSRSVILDPPRFRFGILPSEGRKDFLMTRGNTLLLMVKLSGLKLVVRITRLGCDTDLARNVQDVVTAVLHAFRIDLEVLVGTFAGQDRMHLMIS